MTLCFNKARKFVLLCSLLAGCLSFGQSLPPIVVNNNNHSPSGVFRAGVLTVALDIEKGEWRPEVDSGIQLAVYAFWHEPSRLTNGIYGPLIVLPPGEKYDPASDLIFVLSIGDFGELQEMALINGTPQSKTLNLQAGKTYRLRFINISTSNQGMQVSLRNTSGPVDWMTIAKDGIDLPGHSGKAQLTVSVGETYDVEFSTPTPQDLLLDLLLPGQKIHTTQTLAFLAASPSRQ
jgi:hypothetical protein